MLSRVLTIVTLCLISFSRNSVSQKKEKCDYCKHFTKTGLSPYEILWTLKEEIGRELPSQVLEAKMMLRTDDIKAAEGVFLEYCRQNCKSLFENKKGEAAIKTLARKGKVLHFLSREEEEKFTKLPKQEFKKLKKKEDKHVKINFIRKKSNEVRKETTKLTTAKPTPSPESNEADNKYMNLYQNVLFGSDFPKMPGLDILERFSNARSLQNRTNSSTTKEPEPTARQTESITTTENPTSKLPATSVSTDAPDIKGTENPNENGNANSLLPTITTLLPETTEPTTPKVKETTTKPDSDDSTEEPSPPKDTSSESMEEADRPYEKLIEEELEKIARELFHLGTGETLQTISEAIIQTTGFIKCLLDLILSEIEQYLMLPSGLFMRERCHDTKTLASHMMPDLFAKLSSLMMPLLQLVVMNHPAPPIQVTHHTRPHYLGHLQQFGDYGMMSYDYGHYPTGDMKPNYDSMYSDMYSSMYYDHYPLVSSRSLGDSTRQNPQQPTMSENSVEKLQNYLQWRKSSGNSRRKK